MRKGSRRIQEECWGRLCGYKQAKMVIQSAEEFVMAEKKVECISVLPGAHFSLLCNVHVSEQEVKGRGWRTRFADQR